MKKLLLIVSFVMSSCSVAGTTPAHLIHYGKATAHQINALLTLMDQAAPDKDKIVILPHKFRQEALAHAIAACRLFVARDQDNIIAVKKLFVMADQHEIDQTLTHELRCIGHNRHLLASGSFRSNGQGQLVYTPDEPAVDYTPDCDVYLYNGGDFTAPEYRKKNINTNLMQCALRAVHPEIVSVMQQTGSHQITVAYGITKDNDARTQSIVKDFFTYLQEKYPDTSYTIKFYKYRAYKPSFNADAQECKPLPDDQSIPGYGCLLTCVVTHE